MKSGLKGIKSGFSLIKRGFMLFYTSDYQLLANPTNRQVKKIITNLLLLPATGF
jgi:hypothetical protein